MKTEADRILVEPLAVCAKEACLDCGESGTTLRFILPIAAALGGSFSLEGRGRLARRPLGELCKVLELHGCKFSSYELPLSFSGKLQSGDHAIAGNISSQYISGLLLAAPLTEGRTNISLTTALESKGYVDMTCSVMSDFGAEIVKSRNGFTTVNGAYISPGEYQVEADWSNAAFWLAANSIGHEASVSGLCSASAQPDRAVTELLPLLGRGQEIDVSQFPDLLPVLAAAAAFGGKETRFVNGARLRLKESDRISCVVSGLQALGARVQEEQEGLIVFGGGVRGGTVSGCNDHRLVMSWAIAASMAKEPTVILGAEAVAKSYPDFWEDYKSLGGEFHVI